MIFAWLLSALALLVGAAWGVRALLDPDWIAKLVHLRAEPHGGGQAEFRATFGGVFFAAHALALFFTGFYLIGGEYVVGVCAIGAGATLSAAWAGAALGRVIAIWRDGADTRFNRILVGVEVVMAFVIALPWVMWFVF